MAENDKKLSDIPAPSGTPSWALTVAFLSSVLLTAFGTFYVSVSPDIKTYLGNRKEVDLADIAARAASDKRSSDGVQALVGWYTDQIIDLTKSYNKCLGDQAALKKQLEEVNLDLEKCQKLAKPVQP